MRVASTLILAFLFLPGCRTLPSSNGELQEVRRSQPLLGTFVVISAVGPYRPSLIAAIEDAFNAIRRVDSLMSLHRPDSELSRVNHLAPTQAVAVSDELYFVLDQAQHIAARTAGSFDVTIRPIADLWGFIWKEYRLPTQEELSNALDRVGYQFVELNETRRTVRFLKPGVSLDLGGIAKGYAVDQAMAALHRRGVTNALVRAGGDVRVSGHPPGRETWPIQLEDPAKQGRRLQIELRDAAVSTSGSYENYFIVGGRQYSHLLDPRTGWPVEGITACTLVAPSCLESDAWATACFVYGPKRALAEFGEQFPMRFVLPDQNGSKIQETHGFPHSTRDFPALPPQSRSR